MATPQPPRPQPSRLTAAATAALTLPLALTLAGCGFAQSDTAAIEEGPVYAQSRQADVLDVQVVRRGTRLTLTNTTARAFGPCRMWLNQWYSRDLDGLAVGQSLSLPLSEFKDRYGAPFRAGGFFATEAPDRVVLTQLEAEGQLIGLVTIDDREDR
jgi:hypothetical protein